MIPCIVPKMTSIKRRLSTTRSGVVPDMGLRWPASPPPPIAGRRGGGESGSVRCAIGSSDFWLLLFVGEWMKQSLRLLQLPAISVLLVRLVSFTHRHRYRHKHKHKHTYVPVASGASESPARDASFNSN